MPQQTDPLSCRFGNDARDLELGAGAPQVHHQMARRASVRKFEPEAVPLRTLRRFCALALCAPTKSDLQQCDIVIVEAPQKKVQISALLAAGPLGQTWIRDVPSLLIFCGNNRRQRRLHELRSKPFANDHLDAFFNAAVDAAIVLSAFVIAAEAEGLGVCPISAVRNYPDEIAQLLELPDLVFPVAGLAVGYPVANSLPSMRLPLSVSIHRDRHSEQGLDDTISNYDARRQEAQPYTDQRHMHIFGKAEVYSWSEDKARQYALPERASFGAYIRKSGFKFE